MQCHSTVFLSRDWGVCLCLLVTEELNPLLLSHPQELENIDTWSQVLTSDVKPNEVWPVWQIRKWFSNKHCFTQQTIANTFVIKALCVSSCDHLPPPRWRPPEHRGQEAHRRRSYGLSGIPGGSLEETAAEMRIRGEPETKLNKHVSNLIQPNLVLPVLHGRNMQRPVVKCYERNETSVTIRDIPPSRSQISSSGSRSCRTKIVAVGSVGPGQDECWQECAKGAMCWEMVNPKTIDIYWLYTSIHYTGLYVLRKKVHHVLRIFRICI